MTHTSSMTDDPTSTSSSNIRGTLSPTSGPPDRAASLTRSTTADIDVNGLLDRRLKNAWGRSLHPPYEENVLHQMIADVRPSEPPNWPLVQERCRQFPHEASQLDRRGRTCLHAAVAKKPPVDTVQAILLACGRNGETIMERDKHGRTPLTIAISSNAKLEVISLLLRKCPAAASINDHLGHLPLHLACAGYDAGQEQLVRILLQAFPQAAARESFNGRTPLHWAIEGSSTVPVIQQLVRVCPEAVVKDGCGLNPLFVAIRFNASVQVVQCLVQAYPSCTLTRDRGNGLPLRRAVENQSPVEVQACLCTCREVVLDADSYVYNTALHAALEYGTAKESMVELMVRTAPEIALTRSKSGQTPLALACARWQRFAGSRRRDEMYIQSLWRNVDLLLRAAYYKEAFANPRSSPTMHAAVSLQVPTEVFLRIIEVNPEQANLRDSMGKIPLQLAIENRPSLLHKLSLRSITPYLEQKEIMIFTLLDLAPQSALRMDPRGRSALSLSASATSISEQVIVRLWEVHPAMLWRLDPIYHLYPFQIAALKKPVLPTIASEKATQEWRRIENLLQLTIIYRLVQQAPELLHRHLGPLNVPCD